MTLFWFIAWCLIWVENVYGFSSVLSDLVCMQDFSLRRIFQLWLTSWKNFDKNIFPLVSRTCKLYNPQLRVLMSIILVIPFNWRLFSKHFPENYSLIAKLLFYEQHFLAYIQVSSLRQSFQFLAMRSARTRIRLHTKRADLRKLYYPFQAMSRLPKQLGQMWVVL